MIRASDVGSWTNQRIHPDARVPLPLPAASNRPLHTLESSSPQMTSGPVEDNFGWLGKHRRPSKDDGDLSETSVAWIQPRCAVISFGRLPAATQHDPVQTRPDSRGTSEDPQCDVDSILTVPPAGFEPAISTLKGWRPRPLDHGGVSRHRQAYVTTYRMSIRHCCEQPEHRQSSERRGESANG